MKKLYHFCYGPGMKQRSLERVIGVVGKINTYKLLKYELTFNVSFVNDNNATVPNVAWNGEGDSYVEGVLYYLSDDQTHQLDKLTNWPYTYEKRYILHPDGNIIWFYICTNPLLESNCKPSLFLLGQMIEGAEEHGLATTHDCLTEYAKTSVIPSLQTAVADYHNNPRKLTVAL